MAWLPTSMKANVDQLFSVFQTRDHENALARKSQWSNMVNSTANHSQRTNQEVKRRSVSSNATQDSESNGPRRVKNPRKPRMVKSSAKLEKDGSPSQNPSNVSETKFPVINKFLINSIAKIPQMCQKLNSLL